MIRPWKIYIEIEAVPTSQYRYETIFLSIFFELFKDEEVLRNDQKKWA